MNPLPTATATPAISFHDHNYYEANNDNDTSSISCAIHEALTSLLEEWSGQTTSSAVVNAKDVTTTTRARRYRRHKSSSTTTNKGVRQSHHTHKRRRRSVSFDTVTIRHFPCIMGDHPACSSGVPVSLDWNHRSEDTLIVPVQAWENYRQRTRQASREQLTLSAFDRFQMVRCCSCDDYSLPEIIACVLQVKQIQRERQESARLFFQDMVATEEYDNVDKKSGTAATKTSRKDKAILGGGDYQQSAPSLVAAYCLRQVHHWSVRMMMMGNASTLSPKTCQH